MSINTITKSIEDALFLSVDNSIESWILVNNEPMEIMGEFEVHIMVSKNTEWALHDTKCIQVLNKISTYLTTTQYGLFYSIWDSSSESVKGVMIVE